MFNFLRRKPKQSEAKQEGRFDRNPSMRGAQFVPRKTRRKRKSYPYPKTDRLTVEELSQIFGLDASTINKWARMGDIPSSRAGSGEFRGRGRRRYFSKTEIETWMLSKKGQDMLSKAKRTSCAMRKSYRERKAQKKTNGLPMPVSVIKPRNFSDRDHAFVETQRAVNSIIAYLSSPAKEIELPDFDIRQGP